jgi:6-phosphogluconolactonase (cycloisomerase 2 family)
MSDLETRMRDFLRRRAHDVEPPVHMSPDFRGHVRRRQLTRLALGIMTISLLAAAITVAGNMDVFGARESDAAQSPGNPNASSVYVFEVEGSQGNANVFVYDVEDNEKHLLRRFEVFAGQGMVPSPDGSRLYVATTAAEGGSQGTVSIFDTQSGDLIEEVPGPQPLSIPRPPFPIVTVSPDAQWLHVLALDPDSGAKSVATMDTQARAMLPKTVIIDGCDPTGAIPSAKHARGVYVICEDSNEIVFASVADDGSGENLRHLALPENEDVREDEFGNQRVLGSISYAALSSAEDALYVVTLSGRIYKLDPESGRMLDQTKLRLPNDDFVGLGQVELSNDGQRLYLGVAGLNSGNVSIAERVVVIDTADWRQRGVLHPPGGVSSFAIGPRPGRLVGVNAVEARMVVIDAAASDQAGAASFDGIGNAPFAVEVPELGQL